MQHHGLTHTHHISYNIIYNIIHIYKYTTDFIPGNLFNCWPGALTIIVNDLRGGTTAFRCPGDEWLRKHLRLRAQRSGLIFCNTPSWHDRLQN